MRALSSPACRAVDCGTREPIRLEPGYISDVSQGAGFDAFFWVLLQSPRRSLLGNAANMR